MTIFHKKFRNRVKRKSGFFIVLFFWSIVVSAQGFQQRLDSLLVRVHQANDIEKVTLYVELSKLYWASNPDSSIYFANRALDFAKLTNSDELLGDAYNSLGNAYSFIHENQKSLDYYTLSKKQRDKVGDLQKVAFTLNNMALVYADMGKYTEAIDAYKEVVEICEANEDYIFNAHILLGIAGVYKTVSDINKALEYGIKAANIFIHYKDQLGMASAYSFIGSLHRDLNNISLALEYYKKAYSIYVEQNDVSGISSSSNNLGIIYDELDENEKALDFYSKSLAIAMDEKDKRGIATALNNIGYLHAKIKNYRSALESYMSSLRTFKEIYDYSSCMNTLNNIAWVHYHSKNIEKAMEYVLEALSYEPKTTDLQYKAESQEILSKIYLYNQDYKKAFEHNAKFMELKDSLYNIDRNEKLMEMQVRFETERKEQEIQLLKKNDEIKNLEIKRQKNLQRFWWASSVLLLVIAVLIYSNLQSKKSANQLLSEKNKQLEEANAKLKESEEHLKELNATKDRFFSIIAHDLKNPFNALLGFSEYLMNNFETSSREESKEYIKIIYESAQNLFKLLHNLLQWSRTQLGTIVYKPELFPLLPSIHQEIEFLEKVTDNKNIKVVVRVENHLMVYADKNIISTVIRNLLSNAIKFSNIGGKIAVNAQEQDKYVEVSITDSGVGMSKDELDKLFRLDASFSTKGTADEEGTGLGLLLCKEFIEKNGGKIWVTSKKEKGSTFSFTLPIHRWG